ncbi:unnamed protein product, partial [Choristocarpus tenellus]
LFTLVGLALATNILVGTSSRWRPTFASGVLVSIVAYEYYLLYYAVTKVSSGWADQVGTKMERWECLHSDKGGKRAMGSESVFDINPCWCPLQGSC